MSSTRSRGRATELKAKHWLERQGYEVQIAPMPTRWSRQNDFFGLWDLIAIKPDEILFVQVKMNRNSIYGKSLNAHREWRCPANKICLLWEPRARIPEVIMLA